MGSCVSSGPGLDLPRAKKLLYPEDYAGLRGLVSHPQALRTCLGPNFPRPVLDIILAYGDSVPRDDLDLFEYVYRIDPIIGHRAYLKRLYLKLVEPYVGQPSARIRIQSLLSEIGRERLPNVIPYCLLVGSRDHSFAFYESQKSKTWLTAVRVIRIHYLHAVMEHPLEAVGDQVRGNLVELDPRPLNIPGGAVCSRCGSRDYATSDHPTGGEYWMSKCACCGYQCCGPSSSP